jgi:hypothetical protein
VKIDFDETAIRHYQPLRCAAKPLRAGYAQCLYTLWRKAARINHRTGSGLDPFASTLDDKIVLFLHPSARIPTRDTSRTVDQNDQGLAT